MNRSVRLYSRFGQLTDYLLPLLVLYIIFRGNVNIILKVFLVILVLLFIWQSLNSYRVRIEGDQVMLNNIFLHKIIPLTNIMSIERKPFYYSSSGGIGAFSYKLTYRKDGAVKSAIAVVGKAEQHQRVWNDVKKKVARKA